MFLSTEIMLQGVLLNLVAFGRLWGNLDGEIFGLFVLVVAAVEAGLGLGLVVLLYRRKGTLDAEAWATMSG
jgi:NADH-quinone oxidoreductase subunit K